VPYNNRRILQLQLIDDILKSHQKNHQSADRMALTGKRFVANLAFFLAVVKVPSDVFEVRSLGAQLDRTQLTLKQLVAGLVNVVLVLSEAVFVRRHKVALVARIRLGRRVTCTTGKSHFDWNHSLHTSFYLRTNIYFQVMHLTPQLYT